MPFVKIGDLVDGEVDASRTPDLVPAIAVLGAVASGNTTVFNAEHVRHKETDRLHAMAMEFSKMGLDILERPDGPTESCTGSAGRAKSTGLAWR